MKSFNFHCQGESHKAIDKVCQDFSYSDVDENGIGIAIVCDGHGGKRYFRSDIGAKFATEIAEQNIKVFLKEIDENLFANQPYTPKTAIQTEIDIGDFEKETLLDKAFRQLFASIIGRWHSEIIFHAKNNPLTDKEKETVEQRYQDEFSRGNSIEKNYGCTLMAYVCTPKFWFAFHIGDGKCISFDENATWKEPIPWDDRCFLNKTTSLCDSDAINEFRYCYEGDGKFPVAVFLGSDGIDDSFGEEANLVNFYVQVAKSLIKDGCDSVSEELKSTLPVLSKRGSQDDMSVACIYDDIKINAVYSLFIDYQIAVVKSKILSINNKIQNAIDKKSKLRRTLVKNEKIKVELHYAITDIESGYNQKRQYVSTVNSLLKERFGESFIPYNDDVGECFLPPRNTRIHHLRKKGF